MSDRIRIAAGAVLMIIGLVSAALPAAGSCSAGQEYRASGNRSWRLEEIRPYSDGSVRVNEADAEDLMILNGIGKAYAQRIVEERRKNGPYMYPEDLEAVSGIGPQTLAGFRMMIDLSADYR